MYVCTSNKENTYGQEAGYAELASSLKELAAHGVSVDLSITHPEDHRGDVRIEQVGEPTISVLPEGLTAFVVDLILINCTEKTIYLRGLELHVPWENSALELVSEVRTTGKHHQSCFPRLGDLRPSASQSNRRGLMEYGTLTRRPLQGRLYAVGGLFPKISGMARPAKQLLRSPKWPVWNTSGPSSYSSIVLPSGRKYRCRNRTTTHLRSPAIGNHRSLLWRVATERGDSGGVCALKRQRMPDIDCDGIEKRGKRITCAPIFPIALGLRG